MGSDLDDGWYGSTEPMDEGEFVELVARVLTEIKEQATRERHGWRRVWRQAGRRAPPIKRRDVVKVALEVLSDDLGDECPAEVDCVACSADNPKRVEGACRICGDSGGVALQRLVEALSKPEHRRPKWIWAHLEWLAQWNADRAERLAASVGARSVEVLVYQQLPLPSPGSRGGGRRRDAALSRRAARCRW